VFAGRHQLQVLSRYQTARTATTPGQKALSNKTSWDEPTVRRHIFKLTLVIHGSQLHRTPEWPFDLCLLGLGHSELVKRLLEIEKGVPLRRDHEMLVRVLHGAARIIFEVRR
jgi:hypothetical protein